MNLERELRIAVVIARAAGQLILRCRENALEPECKANGEIVTVADRRSDQFIRSALQWAYPSDGIFSEESPLVPHPHASRVWIVDPLDGTSNFVSGGDEYVVSIGLAIAGVAVLGVVYNPCGDELFAGTQETGVTLNDVSCAPRRKALPEQTFVSVSRKEWIRDLRGLSMPFPVVPMASMAHKLARVAAGLEDGTFSLRAHKQWGTCAGVALVEAAGARVTLLDGSPVRFDNPDARLSQGLVAAVPPLHEQLLASVQDLVSSLESGQRNHDAGQRAS